MKLRLSELVSQKGAREGRKITQQELADALGISQQRVSVLFRGSNKQVSLTLLDQLADYFGVPTQYLFEGGPEASWAESEPSVKPHEITMLPVLGRINAGPLDEQHQEILDRYPWPTSLGARPGCFVLIVSGDSMVDAHILPGSQVIVDPKLEARSGDIVAALVNGESALKRLYFDDSKRAVLLSENREKNYPPIFVDGNAEAQVQGVVVNIVITPELRRSY